MVLDQNLEKLLLEKLNDWRVKIRKVGLILIVATIDVVIKLLENDAYSVKADFRLIVVWLHPFQNGIMRMLIKGEYLDMNELVEQLETDFLYVLFVFSRIP